MKTALLLILTLVTLAFSGGHAEAATVTLSWDAITDAAVIKVNIYQSQSATAAKPWPLKTSVTAPANQATFPLASSGAYYWYATAASATAESSYSNEVAGTIPLSSPSLKVTILP